ncbi:AAA family ATPase [Candidatus Parcubacteria bacterium]|nr:AAA family ATPase [Candidatus Parcubacteria bacterium]
MSEKQVSMIVLTGGPCSGKSSALAYLSRQFTEHGYKVIIVPEAARLLISNGIAPWELTGQEFQYLVFKTIVNQEEIANEAALSHSAEKILILCDRGLKDGFAYDKEGTLLAMRGCHFTDADIFHRYQAVRHLVTAADGADSFYTNDDERKESKELARALDAKILHAWSDHPHLQIIDNGTDFEKKLFRTYQSVCATLGIPIPIEIENKYLVTVPRWNDFLPYHTVNILQVYLENEDRVREWRRNNSSIYYRTSKKELGGNKRVEVEKIITRDEFDHALRTEASEEHEIIRKERLCFVWNHQRFELDVFQTPTRYDLTPRGCNQLMLMEVELINENDKVDLPPQVKIINEVTLDKRYSNANIAKKRKYRTH